MKKSFVIISIFTLFLFSGTVFFSVFQIPNVHLTNAQADTSPTIYGPASSATTSVTVASGGATYIYASTTGGEYGTTASNFVTDFQGGAAAFGGYDVVIGYSSNNVGALTSSAGFPSVSGIGISLSNPSIINTFETGYDTSPVTSLTGSFTLTQSEFVVIASASDSNIPGSSFTGISGMTTYYSSYPYCCGMIGGQEVFAYGTLAAGPYSFTVSYNPWVGVSGVGDRDIGAVVYGFSTTISQIPGTFLQYPETGNTWTYTNSLATSPIDSFQVQAESNLEMLNAVGEVLPFSGTISSAMDAASSCQTAFQVQSNEQTIACVDLTMFTASSAILGDVNLVLSITPGGFVGNLVGGAACSAATLGIEYYENGQGHPLSDVTAQTINGVCTLGVEVAADLLLATPLAVILKTGVMPTPEFPYGTISMIAVALLPLALLAARRKIRSM